MVFFFFRFAQQKSSLDSIHQSTFTKQGAIPLRPTCFRNHDTCYSGGTLLVAKQIETKRDRERALLPSTQTHKHTQHSLAKDKNGIQQFYAKGFFLLWQMFRWNVYTEQLVFVSGESFCFVNQILMEWSCQKQRTV